MSCNNFKLFCIFADMSHKSWWYFVKREKFIPKIVKTMINIVIKTSLKNQNQIPSFWPIDLIWATSMSSKTAAPKMFSFIFDREVPSGLSMSFFLLRRYFVNYVQNVLKCPKMSKMSKNLPKSLKISQNLPQSPKISQNLPKCSKMSKMS